jgi:hypothetical protein
MGVERRRAGFRLPWSADGEESDETQAAMTEAAGEASPAEPAPASMDSPDAKPMTATDPPAATESAAVAATGDAIQTATADEPAADETTSVNEPMGEGAMTSNTAAGPEPAPATDGESADFLKSLVGAMRTVAESSRETSLAELRSVIDERIETLRTQAAERETDIRRQADTDLEAVGEWERAEIDRVKAEAETKRADRRMQLERQLAAHRTASDQAVESARNRLAQHESELAAFFAQLGEITDPAAFVDAAKRMPPPPELGSLPAADSPASPDGTDPRLAALGVTPEMVTTAAEAAGPATPETTETAEQVPSEATAEVGAATNGTTPAPDAQLAERLAQLDERLSAQPATPAATAPATAGGEASTAIVVKGLGSFGAITSFKQSLERVEGVRGVTLSLGPTGEFVYRASHAGDFDLVGAIQGLEGPTASIENTDGTLVVTLSRAR